MTGTKRIIMLLPLLVLIPACLFATPFSENGKLAVSGNFLVNSCGNQVQLKGVSSHGIQWFADCLPDAALDYAANVLGADAFRIAMYVNENGYLTNPAGFTSQVDTLVDKIGARGMYAIIDWHILTPGDPNVSIADARIFWQHEAQTHANKDYVIYEICNEPNGVNWATIKTYADNIIGTYIRPYDPDAVIIVGTPNWSQLGAEVVSNKLTFSNIMYTFHFYAASHTTAMLTPYIGQLPIFVTEWATTLASGDGTRNEASSDAFHTIMNANKISWTKWSFADDTQTNNMFTGGTCPGGPYNDTRLTAEGIYTRNKIQNPANVWTPCTGGSSPTFTPSRTRTGTPTFTRTIGTTPSFTSTRTRTPTSTYTRTTGPSPTITPTPSRTATSTITSTITPTPVPSSVAVDCGTGITIDGNTSDAAWQTGIWTDNNRLITGTNPQGVSSQFKVRWDNTNLYVAVDVTDSTPFNDSGATWYEDSSVEVYLDMNHNHSTTYAADDFQFSMRYNDAVLREQNNKQGAAAGAVAVRAGGYVVEMRLPWSVLGVTPAQGNTYGIDIGVNVDSGGGAREGVLMWSGTTNNYMDTSAFGNAVLGTACAAATPTFTRTATGTFTRTATGTFSRTATQTYTGTQLNTPTFTQTQSATGTFSRTATPTYTRTTVITPTFTHTRTVTASPTSTRTNTPVNTVTNSPINTATFTRTVTATATPQNTGTSTATLTNTPVNTSTSTRTNTPVNTSSATASVSPSNTITRTPTNTPVNTGTFTRTETSTYTRTSTPTYTRTVTSTFTRTVTLTSSSTLTITPYFSPTSTATITVTWTGTPPSPTNTPTITTTSSSVPSSTVSPSSTRTSTPVNTQTSTPVNTQTNTPVNTQTNTPVNTRTNTPVNTSTNTPVNTQTNTPVNTMTNTPANTSTYTRTNTSTYTRTTTPTSTRTVTLTYTLTPSFTISETRTPTPSISQTWTGTPPTLTFTPTISRTWTASPTDTPVNTETITRTYTATATQTFTSTRTATALNTATFTRTVTRINTPTNTAVNTSTNTPVNTATNTPLNTATNTATETRTATATSTFTLSVTLTATRTTLPATLTYTPTLTLTILPSATLTATLTPTVVPTREVFEILNPSVFPNPYKPGTGNPFNFSCDLTQDAKNLKIRFYTTGFRAVKEINIQGTLFAGRVDLAIQARELNRLASGVYYYIVSGESLQGIKVKTKPAAMVILR